MFTFNINIYIDYYLRDDLDRISDIIDYVEKNYKI